MTDVVTLCDGKPVKKVAIMQPYLFPYLGYYQLAAAVDQFVFLDDVNYIKSGFVNRNLIDLNGRPHRFVLPVEHVSQNRSIKDHSFTEESKRVLATIGQAYRHHPQFSHVFPIVERTLSLVERGVAEVCAQSIRSVFDYLDLAFTSTFASSMPDPRGARGAQRIAKLATTLDATHYYNASGGRALYDRDDFHASGIALKFLTMRPVVYTQPHSHFLPSLSMLDVLMCCAPEQARGLLEQYDLD